MYGKYYLMLTILYAASLFALGADRINTTKAMYWQNINELRVKYIKESNKETDTWIEEGQFEDKTISNENYSLLLKADAINYLYHEKTIYLHLNCNIKGIRDSSSWCYAYDKILLNEVRKSYNKDLEHNIIIDETTITLVDNGNLKYYITEYYGDVNFKQFEITELDSDKTIGIDGNSLYLVYLEDGVTYCCFIVSSNKDYTMDNLELFIEDLEQPNITINYVENKYITEIDMSDIYDEIEINYTNGNEIYVTDTNNGVIESSSDGCYIYSNNKISLSVESENPISEIKLRYKTIYSVVYKKELLIYNDNEIIFQDSEVCTKEFKH